MRFDTEMRRNLFRGHAIEAADENEGPDFVLNWTLDNDKEMEYPYNIISFHDFEDCWHYICDNTTNFFAIVSSRVSSDLDRRIK